MGAERCPQCGQAVGRADYQCPSCELVLSDPRRGKSTERREVSVVRAMMERPRPDSGKARPKKPRRAQETAVTGADRPLVAMDRVLHVSAELRLEKLNLHPYEAWVVSLIDGRSTSEMLADKLALAPRELQGLIQGLILRGVIRPGAKMKAPPSQPRPDEDEPTRVPGEDEEAVVPTEIWSKARLGLEEPASRLRPPPPPPPARPNAKPAPRAVPQHTFIGAEELDDEESTLTGGRDKTERGLDQSDLLRASRGERLTKSPHVEPETLVRADPNARHRPVAQETVLVGKKPSPPKPKITTPERHRHEEVPVGRQLTGPRAPLQAPAAEPRPTMGIEDVDAQGALQVALQMEQSGRVEEAVGYLERAIERSPDAGPLYNRLAIILMRDFDDLPRAEQLIRRALQLSPRHPVFTRNLDTVMKQQRHGRTPKRR